MQAFRLCCAQAKWDADNKLEYYSDKLLALLNDDKPTVIRQCLFALNTVVLYKPDLCACIEDAYKKLNIAKFKDSMRPLIEKDIEILRQNYYK